MARNHTLLSLCQTASVLLTASPPSPTNNQEAFLYEPGALSTQVTHTSNTLICNANVVRFY